MNSVYRTMAFAGANLLALGVNASDTTLLKPVFSGSPESNQKQAMSDMQMRELEATHLEVYAGCKGVTPPLTRLRLNPGVNAQRAVHLRRDGVSVSYRSLTISPEEKESLRRRFLETPEVVPIASDPKFFSLIVSLGIQQEIGTIHDEYSTFLFDEQTGQKIPREHLRAELIEYKGYSGVRVWAEGHDALDPRVRGVRTLLHPEFSYDKDRTIRQCVFFPELITKIAALEGAELVSVRPWGVILSLEGLIHPGPITRAICLSSSISTRSDRLLERRQIVFFGTHDIVSHVAGIKKSLARA